MPFTANTLFNLSAGSPAHYLYVTDDDVATVSAPGYFDRRRVTLHQDDILSVMSRSGGTAQITHMAVESTTASSVTVTVSSGGGAGVSLPINDTTALVRDPADNTKLVRIDAENVATGTTRTITMPDEDVDLGDIRALELKFSGEANALEFIDPSKHAAILDRTSTDDVTAELQLWLDHCKSNKVKGIWPAGVFRISAPLFITRDTFESSFIEGSGGGFSESISQTTVVASQLDTPAIVIEYGRGVYLGNILIKGANAAPGALANITDTSADWLSAGIRSSRYSPHAGICVDPTVSATPPDGGYPGMIYRNSVGGSADIIINSVTIEQFAVGIAASPNGSSSQGDGVRINDCKIEECEYAVSVAQSQSRGFRIAGGSIFKCRTAITNNTHGAQSGSLPAVSGIQINSVYRWFNCSDGTDTFSLDKVYGENIKCIGNWGVGSSVTKTPLIALACYVSLSNTGLAEDPILLETHGPSSWIGCYIQNSSGVNKAFNIVGSSTPVFDSCSFRGGWGDNAEASIGNHLGASGFAEMNNCRVSNSAGTTAKLQDGVNTKPVTISFAATSIVVGVTTITFNTTFAPSLSVGDLIFWRITPRGGSLVTNTVVALEVSGISGNAITCDMLYEPEYYNTTSWHGGVLSKVLHNIVSIDNRTFNIQTGASYTITFDDVEQSKLILMNSALPNTVIIEPHNTKALPPGSEIEIVQQGAGQSTINFAGSLLNGVSSGSADISARYGRVKIVKINNDNWYISGDHNAVS